MYKVLCDGLVLYDPRVDELKIISPKVTLEVNKTGGFDFSIYPTHPSYGAIMRFKSTIELFQDDTLLFRGRVLNDEIGFLNEKKIICEGDLAFFNDSIMRPYSYNGTVTGFLTMLITAHNTQVEADKQFTLGTVTVIDPNDYIVRESITAVKMWEVINKKLIDMLGGYIRVRREGGVNYIDYLADSNQQSLQEIKLGENLLDLNKEINGEDIITALIPYGAKLKDENGKDTDNRLTIADVNDGVDYVFSQEAVDAYGWIFDTQVWDDVTLGSNLKTKAIAALTERMKLNVSLTLSAIDLSMTDATIDKFRVFEYVKVDSPSHLLDDYMLVSKMSLDLLNPKNNKLTLGMEYATFTEKQVETDEAIKDINYTVEKTESSTKQLIDNTVTSLQSSIQQTDSAIRSDVAQTYTQINDFETYKQSVSTSFEQTSESFTFSFNDLSQLITALSGDVNSEFTELKKYIRFVDGNIILGVEGNPIIMKQQNDRLSFFKSDIEVAYISDNKLYITDAQILTSIRIGNYAFIPRQNGNLSFKWVGE